MSVSASMGPSAFSEDGKYYSQIGNDGRCRIWDTETNVLKQEFTPDLHLSAPLSCLYWIQLDGGTSNPKWKSRKRKSSRPEEENDSRTVMHCLAFGSTTGKVLIYSITHAKVESVLEDPNPTPGEQNINCMDWSKKHGLFTCSSDTTIRQWSIEDGSVKSKFRMNKFEKGTQSAKTTAIKIPNYQTQGAARKLLITAACTLKLWCLDSKTILRSMVGHAGDVCHLDAVSFSQDGRFYIISGSKTDRILSFWSVFLTTDDLNKTSEANTSIESKSKSAKRRSRTKSVSNEDTTGTEDSSLPSAISTRPSCNFLMEDIARQVCVRASEGGSSEIKMIAVTRRGVVHYYEHTLNGVSTKPIKPDTTIQVVSEEKSQVKLAAAVCGTLQGDTVLVGYSSCGGLKFERITADTSEKTQVLIRTYKEKEGKKENQKMRSEDITKIRDGDSKDNSVIYLTSAMGRGDSDLKRPIGSKQVDIPMEMRLANLSLTQSGAGVKNGPETKNMAQLLVQALHSKDSKLLQTVFECVDPEVAFNTMNRLPIQYLPALLEHLTNMLTGKTNKCKSACVWASALCRARSSALLNQQLTNTRPLLSAVAARTPALPRLLALRARLGMLTSRSQDCREKPTLEYRDTSSEDGSEDEMDDAIMNTPGDDSGSWNEEDDDEDADGSSKGSDQEMSE